VLLGVTGRPRLPPRARPARPPAAPPAFRLRNQMQRTSTLVHPLRTINAANSRVCAPHNLTPQPRRGDGGVQHPAAGSGVQGRQRAPHVQRPSDGARRREWLRPRVVWFAIWLWLQHRRQQPPAGNGPLSSTCSADQQTVAPQHPATDIRPAAAPLSSTHPSPLTPPATATTNDDRSSAAPCSASRRAGALRTATTAARAATGLKTPA